MAAFRPALLLILSICAGIVLAADLPEIPFKTQPSEGLLIGGQPDEAALRQAAAAGVRGVVNLRSEGEQVEFDEGLLVTELGMDYFWLPIAGADDLTPENVQTFDNILATIGDEPVLMHCGSGNRVGALFALQAGMHRGMETEAAIELGRAHGLTKLEDAVRARLEAAAAE